MLKEMREDDRKVVQNRQNRDIIKFHVLALLSRASVAHLIERWIQMLMVVGSNPGMHYIKTGLLTAPS